MFGVKRFIKSLSIRTKLLAGLFVFISPLAGISIFLITYTQQGIWEIVTEILLINLILGAATALILSRLILTPISRLSEGIYKIHKGGLPSTATIDRGFIRCWEKLDCNSKECPVYGKEDLRCWTIAGTYCLGQIQGVYAQKIGDCRKCTVYKYNSGDEIAQLDDAFKITVRNLFASISDLEKAKKDAEAYSYELELSHKVVNELHKYTNNILNSLSTGIIALDEEKKIKFFNNNAKNILGIDLKNVIGKTFVDVVHTHPDCVSFFEFVNKKMKDFEKKGRLLDNIEKGFILNGHEIIIGLKIMPLYGVKYAKSVPLIIVFDNISEQKRLYKEYAQSKKMAELGIVAAKIAHEVRNPLHVIEGGLHYLSKEYAGDEKITEIIELLKDQVIRLDKVTGDLLEVARPIKGKIEKTNLKNLVLKTLRFMKEGFMEANIDLQVNLDEGLPEVWAYPTELERALVNIVRNSIDASPPGSRIKVITGLASSRDRAWVEIIVVDNGKGIQDKASIFKPFYTTKPNGTGLGMSIVQKIVNQHKGEIRVEDNPEGAGTLVSIRLPLEGTPDYAEHNIDH
ncbi:MAG: ATP-binding protein [Nitrospirota bacterium]|jgi:PAS domain S-box-containing protein